MENQRHFENHENLVIQCENKQNNGNLKNSTDNNGNHKIIAFQMRIMKIMKLVELQMRITKLKKLQNFIKG